MTAKEHAERDAKHLSHALTHLEAAVANLRVLKTETTHDGTRERALTVIQELEQTYLKIDYTLRLLTYRQSE